MKIRLILPICNELKINEKKYCNNSLKIDKRLEILQNSMDYKSNDIDLVVTSNNFFEFQTINDEILLNMLNELNNKKDLLIGIDYENEKNPFNGISSRVLFFKEENNNYRLEKYIWEVWNNERLKNINTLNDFNIQNRIIEIKEQKIFLLSCGDILNKIHQNTNGIKEADIYIDLAHLNYPKFGRGLNNKCSIINKIYNDDKIVLLTQQITQNKINHYVNYNNKYSHICPRTLDQNIYCFNKNHKLIYKTTSNNIKDIDCIIRDIDYIIIDVQVK